LDARQFLKIVARCVIVTIWVATAAFAARAPMTFYMVGNDGVHSDRFSDPETAARVSIDRHNAYYKPIQPYIFDHITQTSSTSWRIYYLKNGGGPYQYGSTIALYYSCDLTPKVGPQFGSDVQGLPRDYSRTPHTCGVPTVDDAKNMGCGNCEGNPINAGRANKYQTEADFRGTAHGTLKFARSYNSTNVDGTSQIPYRTSGALWRNSFESAIRVSTVGSTTSAVAVRPDGRLLWFNLTAGSWVPEADISDRLTEVLDQTAVRTGWEYRTSDDAVETYDANGLLLIITNRSGISQSLTYSDANTSPSVAPIPGLLIGITDSFGQSLAFTYNADKQIQTMTDPGGGSYTYAYDTYDNLQSVMYPDGSTRTYVYGELAYTANVFRPNHLTGIIDESSTRFAIYRYDNYGHAIGSEHGTGVEATSLSYTSGSGSVLSAAAVTDALGTVRTRQFVHQLGVARTSSITQPCGASCNVTKTFAYDAQGNLALHRDFNGNLTCYGYGLTRNLESVRVEGFASTVSSCPSILAAYAPASGTRERKITTTWNSTFRLPTSITESNRTTTFTHDANGNVHTRTVTDTSVTPNLSRTWTYTYNSFGQVLTEDGPRTDVSDVTTYTYYTCTTGAECGQLHTITNSLGHVTSYDSYNAHGQPTQITDPNGLVTSLAYDPRQRLTDRCVGGPMPACSGGELTHLDYWPTGLLKKATNPDASYIEYTYDAAHRLTQVNDGAGNKVVYTLDAMGNRTAENTFDPSNALRRTHSRVYNTLNQLWKDVNAAGTAAVTTVFGYDNNGKQTSVAAPLSRDSSSLYDELNRLKQITDPASGVTQFGYDAQDHLTSVTDPRSLVTSYTYSGFGDLTTQVSPDTGTTTNTYDSGGNLDTSTDSRGAVTTYTYDALNRVTSAAFTLGGTPDPTISYTYDSGTNQKGRLVGASDANHSLAWSYDAHGRVTGKSQTVGGIALAQGYGYNASGQLTAITLPSGNSVEFGYNANNQVTSVTLNGSTTILNSITYDPFGPITGWTWGNGTTASRAFDTDGKLTQIDNANGTSLKNFSYDDAFRITGIADAGNSAYSWTYGYDNLDRLTSATGSSITRGWTYDANGNRLTETGSAPSTFTYTTSPGSNRLASITGSLPRMYGYDTAGNALSYASATFSYNARGRMVSAANSGVTASYVYNALGQRIGRTVAGVTTLYAYDEAGHLQGEYSSTGALIQESVWLGDIPVATIRPNGSGGIDLFYVHTDQLNTPRLVTDTANNLRWRWESDPFGTNAPEEDPSSLGAFKYALRFPGQQFDGTVGLHYNYSRDYDPATGRYNESDPIGLRGGMNTYAYAIGDPIRVSDPSGLFSLTHDVSYENRDIWGGRTGAWISVSCRCEQDGQCQWKLSGCSGKLTVHVLLANTDDAARAKWLRYAEDQHVADYLNDIEKYRRMGEAVEQEERFQRYSSRVECERTAEALLRGVLRPLLRQTQKESSDRYDGLNGPHARLLGPSSQ
jgi:RHS repeat-associated protein